MFARTCVLLLAVGLAACANTVRPVPVPVHDELTEPYRFDSGDKLRITVFDQPSMSQTYMVDQAGYVTFPLVGPVAARGATSQDLARQIAKKLEGGYLKHPDVSVEVDTYRPFFIMGEIKNAGQYTYVPGMTVQNAVAIAGGFTPRAVTSDAELTRQLNGEVMNGRVPLTDPIRPGDTINVRERFF